MDGPNQGHKLIQVQEMDGPNQGHKLILVHKVDGPNHVNNLYMSTTRTDPTTRAVHGLGQVGFGPDPDSTRLNRVTKITTRNRPDIWGRPSGSGHQLIGSDWSVWRVWAWASIWAEFVILHKFFFNSIFDRPFGPKLMGLFLTFIYF